MFSHSPDKLHGSDYVAGSNFPVDETNDPLIRWDSYENFDTTIEGGGRYYLEVTNPQKCASHV